jgi:hypothetical protein
VEWAKAAWPSLLSINTWPYRKIVGEELFWSIEFVTVSEPVNAALVKDVVRRIWGWLESLQNDPKSAVHARKLSGLDEF